MHLSRILLAGLIVAGFVLISLSTARLIFRSDVLSAIVVDVETGDPVPGAVIVAFWKLSKPRFFHGHDSKILHRVETMTDQDGRFSLEAWGPKFALPSWRMNESSPYVYILKSGHKVEILSNYSIAFGGFTCQGSKLGSLIVASWNGCEIKLQRPNEMPESYAMKLSWIYSNLCDREEGAQCGNALLAYFSAEKRRLLALGVKPFY